MNRRVSVFVVLALMLAAAPLRAADAEADYLAWKQACRQTARAALPNGTKEQLDEFARRKSAELESRAAQFAAAHPADPRRWELLLRAVQGSRFRPTADEVARRAALARDRDWMQALLASPDAPAEFLEPAQTALALLELDEARHTQVQGGEVDLPALGRLVEAHAAKFPESRSRGRIETAYLELLVYADPALARARVDALSRAVTPELAALGETWRKKLGFLGAPLAMKFTAADGREVDLAALRGKVVLVDFWATWCGPCMNEMPNVKAVYAKYRTQGFEIVGVSLDGGGIAKGIQSGVKTRDDFLAFLQREAMPWPQHYSNQGWKNEFAQRFGIKSIPAIFLIGRDGNVLSTEARGEALEAQVRRALGV